MQFLSRDKRDKQWQEHCNFLKIIKKDSYQFPSDNQDSVYILLSVLPIQPNKYISNMRSHCMV